jgi:hypothetical protein
MKVSQSQRSGLSPDEEDLPYSDERSQITEKGSQPEQILRSDEGSRRLVSPSRDEDDLHSGSERVSIPQKALSLTRGGSSVQR